MKPRLFVTLTMVKHEKIGQCSLPSGGCTMAWAAAAAWQQQAKSPRQGSVGFTVPGWRAQRPVDLFSGQLASSAHASRRKLRPLRIAAERPLAVNHAGPVAA
jgi:hypothetical protein